MGNKEDRKRKGAELYLKLGNYKQFCEIMIELGEFDRALAYAPAVSLEYWKECMHKYGAWLESHEERFSEAPLPYIAINEIDTAVNMLTATEEYEDSKLVRALKIAGVYQDISQNYEEVKSNDAELDHEKALKNKKDLNKDEKLIELTRLQAEQYFRCGQPILSSCSSLSINDYKRALIQLIRANELFLAYIVAYLLYPDGIKEVLVRLARKAERCMLGKEAKEIMEMAGPGVELEKALMMRRIKMQGFFELDDDEEQMMNNSAISKLSHSVKEVLSEILSGSVEKACEIWLSHFEEALETENYEDILSVIQMYEVLQEVQISKVSADIKAKIFWHLSIIGICKAIWHGFLLIIPGLFNCFIRSEKQMPMLKKFMESIERHIYQNDNQVHKSSLYEEKINFEDEYNSKLYEALMKAIDIHERSKSKLFDEPGDHSFLLSGSNVPSKIIKSRKKTSMISDYYIRGYPFILEDGATYVNINEALEWSVIYCYSPLLNGNRLNPY